jgi:hypothetical protein
MVLMNKNVKKFTAEKNYFLIKTFNLLNHRPPYRMPKPQELFNTYFFQFLRVIFALQDPDPATPIKADPDPKPRLKVHFHFED